jgi:hypothetical protein
LFLRELVLAVEERVKSGWSQAGRLHQSFEHSIERVITYDYAPLEAAEHVWPPMVASDTVRGQECTELRELLTICIETAEGIFDGWLTLTHARDNLQGRPADTLSEAWPVLVRAEGADDPPDEALALRAHNDDDFATRIATESTAATLDFLRIEPRTVYDVAFSVASAANASFTCPYRAVQTCSLWRRRAWQALVLSALLFSGIAFVINATGISFVTLLLIPLFSIVLLQLAYGYTWTCAPMIPVCWWQDVTESVGMLLPLSLEVPDDLKRLDRHCLDDSACVDSEDTDCLALRRFPPPACLKSCREAPFLYVSVQDVIAWLLVELDAADYAASNAHHVPLLDHEAFVKKLSVRARISRRSSTDAVHAHRVCALLGSYMLLPYVFILLLVLAFLASLAQALATQLLPLFMLVCALFSAVAASANTQDEERLQALEKTVLELQEDTGEDEAS